MNNLLCKINTGLLILIGAGLGLAFYKIEHQQREILTELSIDIVNASHINRVMLSELATFLDKKLAHNPGGKLADYLKPNSLEQYTLTTFHSTPNDFLHKTRCPICNKQALNQ